MSDPSQLFKAPRFPFVAKTILYELLDYNDKTAQKSELRAQLFCRPLNEQQNKDRYSIHAKTQRIYRHDARKGPEMLENSIDPDNSDTADAAHRNDRGRQRDSVTSHVSAHYIVEERQQVRGRNEHNADITDLNEFRVARLKDGDHVSAEEQQERDHESFDDDAFDKAEFK